MKRIFLIALTAILSASLLSGCSFFRQRAERKNNEYRMAVEERPLEVPPGLDTPGSSGALTIPQAGSAPTTQAARATDAPPVAAAGAGATAGVVLGSGDLHMKDTVDSAWARVGLALERSGAATVLDRDESAKTYTVQTTGKTTVKPGWLKRAVTLGMADTKKTAQVQLTVRVGEDGDGARVSVEGANDEASRDAARALLATLRERLS